MIKEKFLGYLCSASLALVIFSLLAKTIFLIEIDSSLLASILGVLFESSFYFLLFYFFLLFSYKFRGKIAGFLRVGLFICIFFGALISVVSWIVYSFSGGLFRLQLLEGLTWSMLGPMIMPLIIAEKFMLLLGFLIFIVLTVFIHYFLRVKSLGQVKTFARKVAYVSCFSILLSLVQCGVQKENKPSLLLFDFFESDRMVQVDSVEAKKKSKVFLQRYLNDLRSSIGLDPKYKDLLHSLGDKNIIFVVLESVRAKELLNPEIYSKLKHLNSVRDNTIFFKRMYSQDIRSTKAYPAFDLGLFSLLSWEGYSNNLPKKNPQKSLAFKLKTLGYKTMALVNSPGGYDNNKEFQVFRGYDEVRYSEEINNSEDNSDLKLLDNFRALIKPNNQKFYAMLWPISTHHPYGREYWSDKKGWLEKHPGGIKHGSPQDLERYIASLQEMDEFFGKLIQFLKEKGLYENTVIFACGDHGEAFKEKDPKNVFHGNKIYEESVNISSFIISPKIKKRIIEDRYIPHRDLAASILHLATGNQLYLGDGRSVFNKYSKEIPIYLYNSWTKWRGIIMDELKLVIGPSNQIKVYSLKNNQEKEIKVQEAKVKVLKDKLNDWFEALKVYSINLLYQKAKIIEEKNLFGEKFRIYCDDGKGFREGLKFWGNIRGLNEYFIFKTNHTCKSIRIAPLEKAEKKDYKRILFHIKKLNFINGETKTSFSEFPFERIWKMNSLGSGKFEIVDFPASVDLHFDKEGLKIKEIEAEISFEFFK